MPRILRSSLVAVAAAAVLVTSLPRPATAGCGANPIIGEICTFAFDFCPTGFLPLTGGVQPVSDKSALFYLIGTAYGGDGTTVFQLPDLRGRTTVGTDDSSAVGTTGGGTGTVNARAATASGGVAVPAGQSPFVGLTRCIANTGLFPYPSGHPTGDDPWLGEIMTFAGKSCPGGYVSTDSTLQSITQNIPLYQLIGTTFGGDGISTFGVPNLIGATAVGTGPGVVLGQSGGTTSTVNVQTATAKGVVVPTAQSPFLTVTSCIAVVGIFPYPQ